VWYRGAGGRRRRANPVDKKDGNQGPNWPKPPTQHGAPDFFFECVECLTQFKARPTSPLSGSGDPFFPRRIFWSDSGRSSKRAANGPKTHQGFPSACPEDQPCQRFRDIVRGQEWTCGVLAAQWRERVTVDPHLSRSAMSFLGSSCSGEQAEPSPSRQVVSRAYLVLPNMRDIGTPSRDTGEKRDSSEKR
jgi:hypothetical protein